MSSATIRHLSYEVDRGELTVTFVSGRRYRYFGVVPDTYSRFSRAPLRTAFFEREVRNGYACAELKLRSGADR